MRAFDPEPALPGAGLLDPRAKMCQRTGTRMLPAALLVTAEVNKQPPETTYQ